jgi:adenylate cyclase
MDGPWEVKLYESQNLVYHAEFAGPLELGRQINPDEDTYAPSAQAGGRQRLAIASLDEQSVSRKHVLLEPQPDGSFRLTNLSTKQAISLADGRQVAAKAACTVNLPLSLTLGKRTVTVKTPGEDTGSFHKLQETTIPPGALGLDSAMPTLAASPRALTEQRAILRWLRMAMGVFQSAASSSDFFAKAAQAAVDMVGLDSGRVMLLDRGHWRTEACHGAADKGADATWQASTAILAQVEREKSAVWHVPAPELTGSLHGVKTVVAAPILDRHGGVIGALYGDRRQKSLAAALAPITELEAMLVELLASGVAAGLARLEQEQAAIKARVRFEQFFTPELSRQLEINPDLLQPRDAEISVLFCDVRNFSRFSERLGPALTVQWVGAVMETLSECVRAHRGVLVDYIGDELMAMWGAPEEQPEHAQLACRAALDMLERLPELDRRWQAVLGEPTRVGIGINTGVARVGNTGSAHKFKYGPLGNTINLASRVQGATKYFQTALLVTGATREQLDNDIATRRLCTVRVVNIDRPVDLYEVSARQDSGWQNLQKGYEKALEEFENGNFRPAARTLGNLLTGYPDDGATLVLLSRAVNALIDRSAADRVLELPGK